MWRLGTTEGGRLPASASVSRIPVIHTNESGSTSALILSILLCRIGGAGYRNAIVADPSQNITLRSRLLAMGLAICVGLALVLVAGEYYFRTRSRRRAAAYGRARPIDDLAPIIRESAAPGVGYELRPNLDTRYQGVPLRTNSWCIREDTEIPEEKAADTYRIACLGDSWTFGWRLKPQLTFPSVLERLLNEALAGEMKAEVHNWGVPGYNTAQEVALYLHRATRLDYDLVVLNLLPGDDGPPEHVQPDVTPTDDGSSADQPWYDTKGFESAFLDFLVASCRDGTGCVKKSLEALKECADKDGTRVVVVFHCFELVLGKPNRVALFEELKPHIAGLGIDIIDIASAYERYLREVEAKDSRCLWISTSAVPDPHPNRVACELIAHAIRDHICTHVDRFRKHPRVPVSSRRD